MPNADYLIGDYKPEFDEWKLDKIVKSIFSIDSFAVWQQRNYWEYFPDCNDVNRKKSHGILQYKIISEKYIVFIYKKNSNSLYIFYFLLLL